MTVLDDDRTLMAESNEERTLDDWFEALERMPVPEGYRVEIVEGSVFMSPQRKNHWNVIRRIVRALEDAFGVDADIASDVRVDFPGRLNGYAPDVLKFRDGTVADERGRWRYQDVEFVAEVISRDTGANDYGPKKTAYATAKVPVYLIADPYQRRCHVYTHPKNDDYATETIVAFGETIDLTGTLPGLTLDTSGFPSS
ncbi:Uma2 family endonuclease [Streptomyces sp. NPDC047097]|uniref:Uma2 family endonuclease n=1 Tax=Streptomyces sp. NPDC047097 TaxID=3155260 RepID=UPI0033D18FB7